MNHRTTIFKATTSCCLIAIGAAALSSCDDECSSYSEFSCSEIEAADYNVYFYYPSGSEKYLGQVTGLSSCGGSAHSFASAENLKGQDWGYVCCMIAKGSQCYEKHR